MDQGYTIDDIKRISTPIAREYGVERLALFGSYARGEHSIKSDIDFLVDKGSIKGLKFFSFVNKLEDALGVPIDVLTYDVLRDSLIADAICDEVVLYEG
jgi:predicted nucleotidyltransferase